MIDIIGDICQRATVQQTELANAAPWLFDLLGGTKAKAGARVSSKTALSFAPFWGGVRTIAADIASLPLVVYKRVDQGKEKDTDHPAYRLLRRKPNEFTTDFTFKEVLQAHAVGKGNGYAAIGRKGSGEPEELLILDPDKVTPVREARRLWYVVLVEGQPVRIPGEDILHIKGLGYDGLVGYSVIEYAKETLGLGIAARDYTSMFFGNGARPGAVLTFPGKLDNEQKENIRESWEKMHQGLDSAHRTAILDRGLDLKELNVSAKDSELKDMKELNVRDVAVILGVPPHFLGDPSKTSYKSVEEENKAYLNRCLNPWLVKWESESWDKLLTEEEKDADSHVIEFTRQALAQADLQARYSAYNTALGGTAFMTVNEVRARENMNTLEDPAADELPVSVQVHPPSDGGGDPSTDPPAPDEPAPDPGASEGDQGRYRPLLVDTLVRMIRRLGVHAKRAAKRGGLPAWLRGAEERHADVIDQALQPVIYAADPDQDAADIARKMRRFIFANIKGRLVAVRPDLLERELDAIEADLPASIANDFFGGRRDGN